MAPVRVCTAQGLSDARSPGGAGSAWSLPDPSPQLRPTAAPGAGVVHMSPKSRVGARLASMRRTRKGGRLLGSKRAGRAGQGPGPAASQAPGASRGDEAFHIHPACPAPQTVREHGCYRRRASRAKRASRGCPAAPPKGIPRTCREGVSSSISTPSSASRRDSQRPSTAVHHCPVAAATHRYGSKGHRPTVPGWATGAATGGDRNKGADLSTECHTPHARGSATQDQATRSFRVFMCSGRGPRLPSRPDGRPTAAPGDWRRIRPTTARP